MKRSDFKWLIGFFVNSSSDKYMEHSNTQTWIIQRAASYAKRYIRSYHQQRAKYLTPNKIYGDNRKKKKQEKRKEKTATKIVAKNEKLQQTK